MPPRKDTAKQRLLADARGVHVPSLKPASEPSEKRATVSASAGVTESSSSKGKKRKKTELPDDSSSDSDAFREEVTQLYLTNKLSAVRTTQLVKKAAKSGTQNVSDLKKKWKMSNEHFKRFEQGFGKHIETPPMYYAKIPIKRDVKTVPKYVWLPFILLHEVLFSLMLSMPADPNIFKFPDNSGFQQMVNDFRSQFHIPSSTPVIPLGFHGDGVPIQKRKSAEVYSWNICIPPFTKRQYFGCLQKEFFCNCGCNGRDTLDAILELFTWSLRQVISGKMPECRHDNLDWRKEDFNKWRSELAGKKLKFRANLFQVRGDWPFV